MNDLDKPAIDLASRSCRACEGGVPPMTLDESRALLPAIPGWSLGDNNKLIRRSWKAKNFMTAVEFFNHVAAIAEHEGHHPDLHLVGYRDVTIELWTHAIGGLSENDFILAAKINQIPFAVKHA